MSVEKWQRVTSEQVADCRVFTVRKDLCENSRSGAKAEFFVVDNPDWVNIIPITNDGQVVLIEQFRQGIESVTLEIPGGMIDPDEQPSDCARRELLEETGYTADKFVYLGRSHPNPAIQSNWIYHFAALGCKKTSEVKFDEHEHIESKLVAQDEIATLIANEEITHSLVMTGFHRFEAYKESKTDQIYES